MVTDNEIIKALECCSCETIMYCEDQCPFYKQCENDEQLSKYALDLINRQKAEIEHLEAENKLLIDRNCELAEKGEKAIITFVKSQNEIKAEAVKEFAERLRNLDQTICDGEVTFCLRDINNLLGEFIKEK